MSTAVHSGQNKLWRSNSYLTCGGYQLKLTICILSNCRSRSAHYFFNRRSPFLSLGKNDSRKCEPPVKINKKIKLQIVQLQPSIRNENSNSPGTVPYQNVISLKCLMQLEVSSGRRRMQLQKVIYFPLCCWLLFYLCSLCIHICSGIQLPTSPPPGNHR